MHNSFNPKKDLVARKPNDMVLKTDSGTGPLEYLIFTSFFTVPMKYDADKDTVLEVDIGTITDKNLKGSFCTRIKNACEKVSLWQLQIPGNGRTKYEFINMFISIKRDEDKIIGIISQKVVPHIKNYFKNGFTQMPMCEAKKLKTLYQLKFLQLFLRFKDYKNPKFKIGWLKSYLGVSSNDYKKYSHFKNKVVFPSFTGINTETSFDIGFKEVKKNNKVEELMLIIPTKNKNKKTINDTTLQPDEFDFALECFERLSTEEQKPYYEGVAEYLGYNMALYDAGSRFLKDNEKLLKQFKTAEEFIVEFRNRHV